MIKEVSANYKNKVLTTVLIEEDFSFFLIFGDTFWGSLIKTVLRRCIVCTICVRYTYQIGGSDAIGTSNRGGYSEIGMFKESVLKTETSGDVIELCPVAWHSSNLILKA